MNRSAGVGYEKHHILPRSLGGSDDETNLVYLTYREHYIAHRMLFNIYPRNYSVAQAYVLMGKYTTEDVKFRSKSYAKARQRISEEISKKHKGTVVVKDVITGKMVGRVSKTHPKYVSGEYVFYQKGVARSNEFKHKHAGRFGELNSRWIDISNDRLLELALLFWDCYGYFSIPQWKKWCKTEHNTRVPSGPVLGRFGIPLHKALAEHISYNRNVTTKQVRSSACSKECRENAKN